MHDSAFEDYALYFPQFAERTIRSRVLPGGDLEVELNDGLRLYYSPLYQTIRRLPDNPNKLSEDESKHEFGYRLKRVLTRKNIRQSDLAKMTGLRQSQISDYVSGKRSPSFYIVDRIAKAIGCSTDEFRYKDFEEEDY